MKIKNYKTLASFAALMIIGLLVMTGCQGLFDPPTGLSAADGNGTLYLSINAVDGRTILPAAQLDEYVLELFVGDAAFEGDYPKSLKGGAGIALPPGTYKLTVKGKLGDVVVAEATVESIVVTANNVTTAPVTLEPSGNENGSFTWDFNAVPAGTDVGIIIYDMDGTDLNLFSGTIPKTGSNAVPPGVYNVKFTVGDIVWWEILYIYPLMDSKYGRANLAAREVVAPIYQVPDADLGYFYLNLNNWQTRTPTDAGINDVVPAGELTEDALKVTFTQNNQRISIKLTNEQTEILLARPGSVKITIEGSGGDETTNFRYFLGDALTGLNWNATGGSGEKKFAEFLGDAGATTQAYNGNKSAGTLGYFILQQRAAVENEIEITSIRIDYPVYAIPSATGDAFYLDLNDWETQTPADANINSTVPTGVLAPDSLTLDFTENNQRVNIKLTAAQVTALGSAANITVTIDGEATSDTTNFRYHLGNPLIGSGWNITSGSGDHTFAELVAGKHLNADNEEVVNNFQTFSGTFNATFGYFILQQRAAVDNTVTLKSIKIEFENFAETIDVTQGEALTNLDDILGIQNAGSPSFRRLGDGGLLIHGRTANWNAIDLQLKPTASAANYEIPVDADTYYRLTVKGRAAVAASNAAEIVQADSPYGNFKVEPLTGFGVVGKIVTFTVEVTDKTGAELMASRTRIRTSDTEPYIIDSIELFALDASDGEDVGERVWGFNIPETLETDGEALTNFAEYAGITNAGSPSFKILSGGGLSVTGRTADWNTVDLDIGNAASDKAVKVDAETYYRVTMTGSAVALYNQSADIVQGDSPYGTFKSVKLTEFGPVNTVVEFEVSCTNKTGSELLSSRTRLRISGTQDYIIYTIQLVALDGVDGEDTGEPLIDIEF